MRLRRLSLLAIVLGTVLAAALHGCANPLQPYRMEIQQGNYITQEMVSQLKLGMTKDQVRFALGTPLINDVFHADRWDYVYMRRRAQTRELEQRNLTVFFGADGRLSRLEGDVVAGAESAERKE